MTTYGVDRTQAAGGSGTSTTVLVADGSQPLTGDWDTGGFDITMGGATVEKALVINGVITPTTISANTNDWAPTSFADSNTIRVSSDAARNLTGIAAGSAGRVIILHNVGSFEITLVDESSSSSAANRFALAADHVLRPDTSVQLVYDGTSSRWRVVGASDMPSPSAGSYLRRNAGNTAYETRTPQQVADELHPLVPLMDGLKTARGLKIVNATASTLTLTCDSIILADASNNLKRFTSISKTPNIASSGANGLDTGSEAANTWYYVWIIGKTDGTVDTLLSTSSTSPTLPSGYTFRALVGAIRNDGSSNFIRMAQVGSLATRATTAFGPTTTLSEVDYYSSADDVMPPAAETWIVQAAYFSGSSAGGTFFCPIASMPIQAVGGNVSDAPIGTLEVPNTGYLGVYSTGVAGQTVSCCGWRM